MVVFIYVAIQSSLMCWNAEKLTRSSPLQGIQKILFQLEVWSKTEDVVQTLLQVRRFSESFRRKMWTVSVCLFVYSCVFSYCFVLFKYFAAPQGLMSGKARRSDCNGESIIYRHSRDLFWILYIHHGRTYSCVCVDCSQFTVPVGEVIFWQKLVCWTSWCWSVQIGG